MITIFKYLLLPFSVLYGLATNLRNWLYDRKIFKYTEFDVPVISVGNLTVGGTGKTPMVEYIIELLKDKNSLATLSRGYGRKTRGFLLADQESSPKSIGDEPFQIYKKYKDEVAVAVGEERILAIPQILYNRPEVQTIVLDDAYQHRAVKPILQILLCDYNRPFYDDLPMPTGRLREFASGAKRADVVVVTKCPHNLTLKEMQKIESGIKRKSGNEKPVFFSSLKYKEPRNINKQTSAEPLRVVLVSGIANVAPLLTHVKESYTLLKHYKFGDHHRYTEKEVNKILNFVRGQENAAILTTEKDADKLMEHIKDVTVPVFVVPIEIFFLKDEQKFNDIVNEAATYKED